MSKNFNTNTANNEEWLTPPYILQALGEFDLDPCSPCPTVRPWPTAKFHYDKGMNGLEQPWFGRVWCNPPYGKDTFVWLEKLAAHGNGIALVFARTETRGFHRQIWEKADAIFFFEGRLKFFHVNGSPGGHANAPSCLAAFGQNNIESIKKSRLKGKLIVMDKQATNITSKAEDGR